MTSGQLGPSPLVAVAVVAFALMSAVVGTSLFAVAGPLPSAWVA